MNKFNKSSSMNHKNGFDHHRINNNHPIHIINNCNSENKIIKEIYEHDLLRKCRKMTDQLPLVEEIETVILEPIIELEQLFNEPIFEIQQIHDKNKTIIESISEKERDSYLKALKIWRKPKNNIIV